MANEIESGTIDCEDGTLAKSVLDSLSSFVSADDLPKVLTAFKRFAAGVAIGWVNNVIASITDGKYLQVSGGEIVGGDGGEGSEGAPVGAAYLVATAHADLTAERVATNTTTVTWDFGVAGQAKANVPDATTTSKGVVELATDGENAAGVAVQGNDSRLSDARTPTAHASSHGPLGADKLRLDDLSAPEDNTDLNVTTSAHGLCPKLPNDASKYLDGTGAYSVPQSLESSAAYDEGVINDDIAAEAGVAFTVFTTDVIPEGFAGYITFEFAVACGTAGSPLVAYSSAARCSMRRATAGALGTSDTGSTTLAEGVTFSISFGTSANAFRLQGTLSTTTTAKVRGWWRLFGATL